VKSPQAKLSLAGIGEANQAGGVGGLAHQHPIIFLQQSSPLAVNRQPYFLGAAQGADAHFDFLIGGSDQGTSGEGMGADRGQYY